MPLYPRFWPGNAAVMVDGGAAWAEVTCPPCGRLYHQCCRPADQGKRITDARRICRCGALSVVAPMLLSGGRESVQEISHLNIPRLLRLLPRNWRAALLGACYEASPAEMRRLQGKNDRVARRLERLGKLYRETADETAKERIRARGRRLADRYQRLNAIRESYAPAAAAD